MPLHKIEWTSYQSGWAIWHITESGDLLTTLARPDGCPTDVTSPLKRMEWAAGRVLIRTMTETAGLKYEGLSKDELGKPHLNNYKHFISLSNAYPYVAAQLDLRARVGIDLEHPKSKILKIAHRVFSKSEVEDAGKDIVKNCIYWCAKEALFKLYGKRGLSFSENLRVLPFVLTEEGDLNGIIIIGKEKDAIRLRYRIEKEYVLVYTMTGE